MSRLPRLRSSSPATVDQGPSLPAAVMASSNINISRKRKSTIDEEDEESSDDILRPLKKQPAVGASRPMRTLQPSRTATNVGSSMTTTTTVGRAPNGPKPLTKPRAPTLSRSTTTRGTSAPPTSSLASSTARRPTTSSRAPTGRTASGPLRTAAAAASTSASTTNSTDKRFTSLQSQLSSLEAARAADAALLSANMESERAKLAELQANHLALSRELASAKSQELFQRRELSTFSDEMAEMRRRHEREIGELEGDVRRKEREAREVREDLRVLQEELERERESIRVLKATISQQGTAALAVQAQNEALLAQSKAREVELENWKCKAGQLKIELEASRKETEELRKEKVEAEFIRRKLHNMVQELKGNIRVFCRVRPVLPFDLEASIEEGAEGQSLMAPEEIERLKAERCADLRYPDRRDHKEIVVCSTSESATGQERKEVYNFGFDRVFEPHASQAEVFEEISQLAQSCTDGYNVCIFAYGQTGSGKSYTMEGGSTESSAGMIPRAVEQVFRVAEEMKSKGWEYTMEGQFLEIYNETINDLLGTSAFDKKKHEIKHDPKTGSTRVTDVNVVPLHSASQVRSLLTLAQSRRSVAATLMNERSSRSHSVFTLRISGVNVGLGGGGEGTGERCEGCLNLVDLAGSERLNVSFANGGVGEKERVRETQSINKSLSALGDVIAALGEKASDGGKHIPYRNSKLTYLLQNSLSGNSKTLMVLNMSPLVAHLNESLTSLRFATKVNNTTIGTAKKQARTS